jgi:hypothetical protein
MPYAFLADLTALLHGAVVLFVLGGLLAILIGLWRDWAWVRGLWFRFTHLVICLVVVGFEIANWPCPLTCLELWLREQAAGSSSYTGSFIAHHVHDLIHLDVSPAALAIPTLLLTVLVAWLYVRHGPRRKEAEKR